MRDYQGESVIAKTHGGIYVFRRIWAVLPWAIEITTEDNLKKLSRGAGAPMPIPFPAEDVYHDDPHPRSVIEAGGQPPPEILRIWQALY